MKNRLPAHSFSQAAETDLIALSCAGDTSAFGEIVKRYQNRVRNFMRRLCNSPDLADDLAQQAFLKAWKSIRQLRSPAAFYGWLKKIMVSIWLEDIRHNKLDFADGDEPDRSEAYNNPASAKIDLDAALVQLSPPMRICVVLAYNEGLSHQEISDLTGIPLGTVKSNISRGATKLRILLSDYAKTR